VDYAEEFSQNSTPIFVIRKFLMMTVLLCMIIVLIEKMKVAKTVHFELVETKTVENRTLKF